MQRFRFLRATMCRDRCVTTKVMLRYHTRYCIPPWSCAWWHRESRDTYGTL